MEVNDEVQYRVARLVTYQHSLSLPLNLLSLVCFVDEDFGKELQLNKRLRDAFHALTGQSPATENLSIDPIDQQRIEFALHNRVRFACAQKSIFIKVYSRRVSDSLQKACIR